MAIVRISGLLSPEHEYRMLGGSLLLLHIALWWSFPGPIAQSLLLAHIGTFLLWQPLFRADRRIRLGNASLFVAGTIVMVVWLNWWLMAFWTILLIGLIGGRRNAGDRDRTANMVALLFLLCELLIGIVPPMFSVTTFSEPVGTTVGFGLCLLPLGLTLLPADKHQEQRNVDIFSGVTLALLASLLVLGTTLSMYHTGSDYILALAQAVSGIALLLLALGWLWAPARGAFGLEQLWTRYLLNIGTPFEVWLQDLADLARERQGPTEFLRGALLRYIELPWVAGVETREPSPSFKFGRTTEHYFDFEDDELPLRTFVRFRSGTALQLHARLLTRLIADFYRTKLRETQLAQRAQVEAIYETGARVTHDIKNLLQSLYAMTTLATDESDRGPEAEALLKRQLPILTQRLQLALDKLQEPEQGSTETRDLDNWWADVRSRHDHDDIAFADRIDAPVDIPADLFDRAMENFIENARLKRQRHPSTSIHATASASPSGSVCVEVSDDGPPPPPGIVGDLFSAPVPSRDGLGVGLYQVANQARALGFHANHEIRDGRVIFSLRGPV
ncbi:MAG: hypothetical protein AAF493_16300 [Pseudomonadota bacterium]